MRRTRRDHIAGFKANVVLAVIRGDKTLGKLAGHFNVHPNQISEWKQQLTASACRRIRRDVTAKPAEPDLKVLHAKIGQLRGA